MKMVFLIIWNGGINSKGKAFKLGCNENLYLFVFIDETLLKTKFQMCFDCSWDLKIGKIDDGDLIVVFVFVFFHAGH